MKSPLMPDLTAHAGPSGVAASPYAPSVPISVYRELAAELQATQSMLDSLNTQNQQLSQQNQRLRLEVDKLVQVSTQVQQVVEAMPAATWGYPSSEPMPPGAKPVAGRSPQRSPGGAALRPQDLPPLVTEQDERRPLRPPSAASSADLGGLWFMTTIVLVIVSAFGAGFIIVRPFLPSR